MERVGNENVTREARNLQRCTPLSRSVPVVCMETCTHNKRILCPANLNHTGEHLVMKAIDSSYQYFLKRRHATVTWVLMAVAFCLVASAGESHAENLTTFGTIGKEVRRLSADHEAELFAHEGCGCLTHMWFGGDFKNYGLTRIRIYVDGEATPSIDMQLMMGHGIGFQDPAAPWGITRMGKTGHPSGIYNTYRIPFGKHIQVTGQLPEGAEGNPHFWWIIRGTEGLGVEVAGVKLPAAARLKLYTRENYTAQPLEEIDMCRTRDAGVLYQTTIAAKSTNLNYLESCVRAYIDGKKKPLLLSSGLEDYFLGTYYFNRGLYHTPLAGLTHLDKDDHSFSAYRFHEQDPVFFAHGLRLTVRCGEKVDGVLAESPAPDRLPDGHVFGKPRATTYTTYVWVYEWNNLVYDYDWNNRLHQIRD